MSISYSVHKLRAFKKLSNQPKLRNTNGFTQLHTTRLSINKNNGIILNQLNQKDEKNNNNNKIEEKK